MEASQSEALVLGLGYVTHKPGFYHRYLVFADELVDPNFFSYTQALKKV